MLTISYLWLLLGGPSPPVQVFAVDPVHHFISFTVQHFSVGKVRARFNEAGGHIAFDPEALADFHMELTIDAASLDTADRDRDAGLISPFWLDAEKHPRIAFTSKSLAKTADGYMVTGDFNLRGMTKEIRFPLQINGPVKDPLGKERLGLEAHFEIDRTEFGMTFSKTMVDGGPFVGKVLVVEVLIEAIR